MSAISPHSNRLRRRTPRSGIAAGGEATAYDEPVDLSGYDSVFFGRGA